MNTAHFKHNLVLSCLLTLPLSVGAQTDTHDHHTGHDQHAEHMDHAGHDHHDHHMASTVTHGPWSYLDRDNPEPHAQDRWVMVPMPDVVHGFRFVREIDMETVCSQLDERRLMVDRATREACHRDPHAMPFLGVAMRATPDDPAHPHEDHRDHASPAGHDRPAPRQHLEHGDHGVHQGHHPGSPPEHAWVAPPHAVAMANPLTADAASQRRGEAAYRQHCASCHGVTGRGDGPLAQALSPRPADLVAHAGHHTDGDYAWKIRTGNGPMPGFEATLDERGIWDVVNYLRILSDGREHAGHHQH